MWISGETSKVNKLLTPEAQKLHVYMYMLHSANSDDFEPLILGTN